jgi:choice-of-anchor C domain-containing protein
VPPVYADPILINGSFELGPEIPTFDINILGGSTAIAGWTVTGARIDYVGPPWDVSDGQRAIDLDGNDDIGGIEQTFATTLGQTYVVSFDLSGNPDGGPLVKAVRVSAAGFTHDYTFDNSGQTLRSLTWQPITFSFLATSASTTLGFTSLSSSGSSYGALIDNVRVEPVPEPSTFFLLGTALASALTSQRHRSKTKRGADK